jgi:amidohydrolase
MNLQYDLWKKHLDAEIEKLAPEVNKLSDYLADNPELGGEEYNSSKAIVEVLTRHGLQVEMPFAGLPTAFKASLEGNGEKKIALLVEYDALPGIGHACGHNVSGSISVLAGLAFSKVLEAVGGRLDIIGTPDEEINGGKIVMAEQGVFAEYDLAIMIHLDNKSRVNTKLLALDGIEFVFTGKASHAAAAPWEGRNALNGVQLMFHAIDMLRQHVKADVRMHGIIADGGEACNIVPEKAVSHFYIRSNERVYLDRVKAMVMDCATGSARATQTEVAIHDLCPSLFDLKPNKAGEDLIHDCFMELGLVDESEGVAFGSSDIGNMSYQCPTLHPTLAITQTNVQLHTREFAALVKGEAAYKVILNGAKILGQACLRVFHDFETAEKIQQDFLRADQ